jgi:hypothetical protein
MFSPTLLFRRECNLSKSDILSSKALMSFANRYIVAYLLHRLTVYRDFPHAEVYE